MEANGTQMISQAVALFDQEKYQEAFKAFVEAYHQCPNVSEQQGIFQILEEAYYHPNQEEMRQNYESNVALLKKYPYFWNKVFCKFEDLSFQLFPVSDGVYYCYDRESDHFSGTYDVETRQKMRYFFEDLDQPIRVEDEDDLYDLTFLNDNVRSSEDFASDNHIYLLYTSLEPLERLMLTCDLEPILRQQKFVFLIGAENWKRYPIDFFKEFSIDYSKMKPAPIRIEEVKRFCLWYAHAYSGSILTLAALRENSHVQVYIGWEFNMQSTVDGQNLFYSSEFKNAIQDINLRYTPKKIKRSVQSGRYQLKLTDLSGYLDWLRQQRSSPHEYTVKELFVGYYLFLYKSRGLNPRVVPMLLFDPHMGDPSVYNQLIFSFPYHSALTCVREPITAFARFLTYSNLCMGWPPQKIMFWFAHDYLHGQVLHPELHSKYFGIRFEDMKMKPEIVCRALCKHLNIPYEEQMLDADGSFTDAEGNKIKGFDNKPLHRDISGVMSEFDQLRLKIFYDPILKHYNYPCFSFEEHPLSNTIVHELFQYPFRLEYVIEERSNGTISREATHQWIRSTFLQLWRQKYICAQLIPLEEPSDE